MDAIKANIDDENLEDDIYRLVGERLAKQKTIKIVYEENLYDVMVIIRNSVKKLVNCSNLEEKAYIIEKEKIFIQMNKKIDNLFNNKK